MHLTPLLQHDMDPGPIGPITGTSGASAPHPHAVLAIPYLPARRSHSAVVSARGRYSADATITRSHLSSHAHEPLATRALPRTRRPSPPAAVDVCVHRPVCVTVGSDHAVRVWNYISWRCEVAALLPEEPTW